MHVNEQIFGDGGNISLAHGAPTPLSAVFLLSVCKGHNGGYFFIQSLQKEIDYI